jgi:hypothetical protein
MLSSHTVATPTRSRLDLAYSLPRRRRAPGGVVEAITDHGRISSGHRVFRNPRAALPAHRAFNLVFRGLFGPCVRVFPRVFGAPGGTCTNRPNRGGTAAALTIGPAATSLFRRASTCRFRPSKARAPGSWRSPVWAKTTSSTVSDLSTISTA